MTAHDRRWRTAAIATALVVVSGAADAQPPGGDDSWTVSRLPDGQPDLQGVWTNATITPFERGTTMPYTLGVNVPEDSTTRTVFTEEEAALLEEQTVAGRPELLGAYNVWMDAGDRLLSTRQTSLVVDPPDGRVPVKASAAAVREAAIARQRDDYRAMSTWDRCITRGVPGSMLPTGYNNAYRIMQTSDHVIILHEMIHEARIIPLDDRPYIDEAVDLWTGDARARWDGDTLVVETRNFNDRAMIFTSSNKGRLKGLPVSPSMRLEERFTRTSEDEIFWEFTVHDPEVYEGSWSVSMPLTYAPGYVMYEYACHEGNLDVAIYMGGGRVEELESR